MYVYRGYILFYMLSLLIEHNSQLTLLEETKFYGNIKIIR